MPVGDADDFRSIVGRDINVSQSPWQRYLVYAGEQAVAGASLFITGNVAGLYYISTLAAARRRGFASAVTMHVLKTAKEQGCRTAVLYATEAGAAVYSRFGFAPYCQIEIWEYRPDV